MRLPIFLSIGLSVVTMIAADSSIRLEESADLQEVVNQAVKKTVAEFAGRELKPEQVAVTVVDLKDETRDVFPAGQHRGEVRTYPASVIKLFYLEAAHHWMEQGQVQDTPELRRALRDMIVDSSNDATHYAVDLLTGTTGGPELPPQEMEEWGHKRNAVNRYFVSRGYTNINANQKTWCEGPYGRERDFVGREYTNRNALTTDATARLFAEVVLGRAVTLERSRQMLELLKRDPFAPATDPDDQAHGFTGPAVPEGARLWSKAGWTSETRHDAACIELPSGRKIILVIFTVGHSGERNIISTLASHVIGALE